MDEIFNELTRINLIRIDFWLENIQLIKRTYIISEPII